MAGENGIFGAAGFPGTSAMPGGTGVFKVMGISYGIQMDYVEKEATSQRTVYFSDHLDDNFAVGLAFNGYDAYFQAMTWFAAYGAFVTNTGSSSVAPMAVIIPFLNFNGVGIPHTGVTFGDSVAELVFYVNLVFEGTYEVITPPNDYSQAPYHAENQYFYPSGTQQGQATSTTEIALYDGVTGLQVTSKGGQVSTPVKIPASTTKKGS